MVLSFVIVKKYKQNRRSRAIEIFMIHSKSKIYWSSNGSFLVYKQYLKNKKKTNQYFDKILSTSASILSLLQYSSLTLLEAAKSAYTLDLLNAFSVAISASILDLLKALSAATLEAAISASTLDLLRALSVAISA